MIPTQHAQQAAGHAPSRPVPTSRMPGGIPYIVANEFAERFCYYGISAILALYLVQALHFGEAQATTWVSLFKSGSYFFPLLGAVVSDVFWGKFRTVITFSLAYTTGCVVLALGRDPAMIALGLFLIAFGTGGIKPCVSTNVGDQFTAANQHLIERAFSWFYLAINAGSTFSIMLCPWLLPAYGPTVAFGLPAAMMMVATIVFWSGRKRFAIVAPAGRIWLREVFSTAGVATILRLLLIYAFIAFFWALWDQSNGTTWSLQARSDLMDKELGFGFRLLPAQVQAVNAVLILALTPLFSYVIYPFIGRFAVVTPLRKIGAGLFITASSFLVVAWCEARIQDGHVVSVWWQILAYVILSAGEVLVSITGLEYSYKQAPLSMKSFIMALFLLAVSVGNLMTAAVNHYMVRPLQASAMQTGDQTWVSVVAAAAFVPGQKIDFAGRTGIEVMAADGHGEVLQGTYLVETVDAAAGRLRLMDAVTRTPLVTRGKFDTAVAEVSTYALVGPEYFTFFAKLMAAAAVVFLLAAFIVKETTHVRADETPA
jgi:POT family proton-dependent oligopeptide transporter